MIQRIQTIYLLLVLIIFAIMSSVPTLNCITTEGVEYSLRFIGFAPVAASGLHWNLLTCWLPILTIIITLLCLCTIWLYKHRILQMRLVIFNSVLMLGYYGLFFYEYYIIKSGCEGVYSINWPIILPFIAVIFNMLAFRGIAKDEALVKSSQYRLR